MKRSRAPGRFDVDLNEKLAVDFQELADKKGVSRAEIFKRALAAYRILTEESEDGARIIVKKTGQEDRQLIAL
jgi:hypothetical protein